MLGRIKAAFAAVMGKPVIANVRHYEGVCLYTHDDVRIINCMYVPDSVI